MLIYTVKEGDTLYRIAENYKVPYELLAEINGIDDEDILSVGQALIIAKPTTVHTVSSGETLYSIAREYGVTISRLLQNNPSLMGRTTIFAGDTLVIRYEGEGKRKIAVNGYAYPFIEEETLDRTLPSLSYLTPFSYGFTTQGDLVTLSDDTLIEKAKGAGVNPVMLLTTLNNEGKFDNSLSHTLFEDSEVQDYLISNILSTMMLKGYRVLDVDFEFVFPEDRLPYVAFLKKLKRALESYRYALWVALAPKTSSDQRGLLYEAHDYKLIGEVADRVLLMTYEWGYKYGPPLAVAPLNEVRRVVEYALTEIPSDKLLLGIPNYGYDFTLPYVKDVSEATVISSTGALALAKEKRAAIQFDEVAKSPYFVYYENGVEHRVWFEDARSIGAKLELADEKNMVGVSFWNIMNYFPQGYFLLVPYQLE